MRVKKKRVKNAVGAGEPWNRRKGKGRIRHEK